MVTHIFWKTALAVFLALGLLLLTLSGILLAKNHPLDLWVRDRYLVVSASHLLILGTALLLIAFVVWKARIPH